MAPNPSRGETRIFFDATGIGPVKIGVFDISGRLVRDLVPGAVLPGWNSVFWNGNDDAGRSVPNGVYHLRFSDSHRQLGRRVLVTR